VGGIARRTSELAPAVLRDHPLFLVPASPLGGPRAGESVSPRASAFLGLSPDTPAELRSFDQFFTPYLLEGPDGAKYASLRQVLETALAQPTVIRLGTIQVHVYLVSRTQCGEVAGVTTISIET
jgi:Nuclease A inhibitor-like protein